MGGLASPAHVSGQPGIRASSQHPTLEVSLCLEALDSGTALQLGRPEPLALGM
jgi:hypothetical protein